MSTDDKKDLVLVGCAAVGALVVAGCSSTGNTPSAGSTGPGTSAGVASASTGGGSTGGGSASSVTVMARSGPDGTYLTDSAGRTLYLWVADTGTSSTCSGTCAAAWPPLTTTTGAPKAGTGVTASQLGTTARDDGTKQVTYNGHPLYYFVQDKSPGQMTGQGSNGFGAAWWIVSPAGSAITASSSKSG